jgi:hypothetical protein
MVGFRPRPSSLRPRQLLLTLLCTLPCEWRETECKVRKTALSLSWNESTDEMAEEGREELVVSDVVIVSVVRRRYDDDLYSYYYFLPQPASVIPF